VFKDVFVFTQFRPMESEEKIFVENFGKNIKKLRLERNLSQEMLANDANIPINQIGRIERAEIGTSINTAFKIAKALDISIASLFKFGNKVDGL
jgi:transcriptional regulator with XRE-family HTH domain